MTRITSSPDRRNSRSAILCGLMLTAIVGFILAAPSSAAATTFTVNSTVDLPDINPGDGICNAGVALCTLRAAITESNYIGGANVITVPAGTYLLTIGPYDDEFNGLGASMDSGDLDIMDLGAFLGSTLTSVTINGAGAGVTIINGGGIDRVLDVNNFAAGGKSVDVTLNGLTITSGNAPTTPDSYNTPGGGIQFDGFDNQTSVPAGTLTINNCIISNNSAAGQGGGVLAIFGSLIVNGSTLSGNASINAAGGGISYDGSAFPGLRTLTITNSRLTTNHANNSTFGSGGGVSEGGNANKTINYNVIANNTAGNQGGGVFNGSGNLTMNFNVIVDNTATAIPGSSGLRNNTGLINAENNWWGCNQGPSSAPCDRASGPLGSGIATWLKLSHTATPNTIQVNQSTTLQADFFTNNANAAISVSDLVALNGRAVTFDNPVLGTISGADPTIQNGKANATYTAGSVGGNGSADATVDHQTVTATILIGQAPMVTTNPTDQTVCDGGTATFTASANGTPAPTVQWQVSTGGPFSDIPGATSTTLSFTASAAQNGNQYRAVFTNGTGTDTTTAATLTVNTAPAVTTNPTSQTVCEGDTVTFTAAASGSPAPTVQWQVSSGGPFTNIPGANSTTLSFTATTAQSGNQYRAVFTNSCGSATTTAATLTVNASTTTSDPADQTVCPGVNATFTTTAGGTGPFTYAWTFDGNPVGGNSPSVTVSSNTPGNHTVTVTTTGTCGSATQSATLTVNTPTTTSDPADQTACPGANATFTTTASGTGPFTYAWTLDGNPVGGNSPSVTVSSNTPGAHTVTVVTTGACGSATQSATLFVNTTTTTSDPVDQTACPGQNATFTTTASGTGPFTYAWTLDGNPVGGNSPSVTVSSNTPGNHTVTVTTSGACGSATQSATLTVNTPTTTSDPADQTVCQGATANFSTTASGTGPFTYAWTLDGSPFGGNTSSISVPTGSLSVGNHTVTVTTTGACGNATQSATLTVNANTTTTDPPDRTVCQGSTTSFTTTASGTGPFSFVWKKGVTVLNNGDLGGRVSIVNTATTSTLTITNVQASDAGTFTVETTGACSTASQSANLTVNNTPPGIVLNGNNIVLWPPDHSYHTIDVTDLVASASSCDGTVNINSVVIDTVTSDEVENGNADGNTLNDIVIGCDRKSVQLRSERDGSADGRVYSITFKVTDSFGNTSTAVATVTVPKNQNTAAVNSGVHYTVTNATCP